jgi:hypothetical protein
MASGGVNEPVLVASQDEVMVQRLNGKRQSGFPKQKVFYLGENVSGSFCWSQIKFASGHKSNQFEVELSIYPDKEEKAAPTSVLT